ncbi:MAG TPA: hypothetical protein VLH56_13190 [Dissulfurispiraceae bacterium]|nr:hypothetical protein [Dissulfurispiraceae bacterium]
MKTVEGKKTAEQFISDTALSTDRFRELYVDERPAIEPVFRYSDKSDTKIKWVCPGILAGMEAWAVYLTNNCDKDGAWIHDPSARKKRLRCVEIKDKRHLTYLQINNPCYEEPHEPTQTYIILRKSDNISKEIKLDERADCFEFCGINISIEHRPVI